jgi:hypothetical protein
LQARGRFCKAHPRMLLRPSTPLALLAVAALALGCGSKPPPKPVEPVAATTQPEAKPPPPKCEKIDEHCDAKADTRARVAHAELYVTPVVGWVFAQGDATTVAQASDSGAAMAFVGYDEDKDAKKDAAARDAAAAELFKTLGVESKPAKKVPWKAPNSPKGTGDLKLDLWEITSGYARGAKKGTVVVVAGSIGDGKGVIGVSFAPADDKSADDAIIKSFESLGKAK